MALRIIWSREALDDTEGIAQYIAKDSEAYAAIMVQRFFSAVEDLATLPADGASTTAIETGSSAHIASFIESTSVC